MLQRKTIVRCLLGVLLAAAAAHAARAAAAEPPYKFLKEIPIGGEGGWDYLYADSAGHRLYVTHGTKSRTDPNSFKVLVYELEEK